jgi:hypothetical protein
VVSFIIFCVIFTVFWRGICLWLIVLFLCCFCLVVDAFICMFCIFMTYSTSCCCHYKLKDPWNVRIYVCKISLILVTRTVRAVFNQSTQDVRVMLTIRKNEAVDAPVSGLLQVSRFVPESLVRTSAPAFLQMFRSLWRR